MLWVLDDEFYSKTITGFVSRREIVDYRDGDNEILDLNNAIWMFNMIPAREAVQPRVFHCRRDVYAEYFSLFHFSSTDVRFAKLHLLNKIEANSRNLCLIWLPDRLFAKILACSNTYLSKRHAKMNNQRPSRISLAKLMDLSGLSKYMGIVKLTGKI